MKTKHNITLFLLALFICACNSNSQKEKASSVITTDSNVASTSEVESATGYNATSDTLQSPIPPDCNLLKGEWIRADGDYVISIRNISGNGIIKAEYFNPGSINVGRSEWKYEKNSLLLYVEMQDINYPGSNYSLQYFPTDDKLAGNYFQAVEGNNYEVVFDRKK